MEDSPVTSPETGTRDVVDAAPAYLERTRTSMVWWAVAVAVVLGVALVVFIVQNTRHVRITFFGVHGNIPVAVALLASALAGAVVVLAAGIARVAQLRMRLRRARRETRHHERARRQESARREDPLA